MKRSVGVFVLLLVCALSSIPALSVSQSLTAKSDYSSNNVPVGALFYLWYGFNSTSETWTGGLGTSHWNDSIYAIVKDRPFEGYYSSMSNRTLAYQIPLMLSGGINFVMVSWWGWGNTSLQSGGSMNILNEAINNATLNLLKWIQANNSTMKVAILVDAFNSTDFGETQYSQIRTYLDSEFFIPYSNEIFNWEGRPLIGWFNPLDPKAPDMNYTDRVIGDNPYVDWTFWSGDPQFLQGTNRPATGDGSIAQYLVGPVVSTKDGEVGVIPKYDDYYLWLAASRPLYMRFDINYSLGMYDYDWQRAIDYGLEIKLVLIYSWNEYHEMSEIEPHATFSNSYANTTYDYNATSRYINQLRSESAAVTVTSQTTSSSTLPIIATSTSSSIQASLPQKGFLQNTAPYFPVIAIVVIVAITAALVIVRFGTKKRS